MHMVGGRGGTRTRGPLLAKIARTKNQQLRYDESLCDIASSVALHPEQEKALRIIMALLQERSVTQGEVWEWAQNWAQVLDSRS
jgi:hypothetical protein